MAVKTIVFDFGGVLIDWNPRYLYRKVFKNETEMERFLTEVCAPEWNEQMDKGKPFKQGVAELTALHPEYAEQIAMFDTRWREMCAGEIAGSVDLLRRLAKKYPVYGLTNWSAEKFDVTYPEHDFFKLFKGIVVSGVEREIKPDPRLFEILIERYGIDPVQTVFTDDSQRNIDTAEKLGFQAIRFLSPEQLETDLRAKGVAVD